MLREPPAATDFTLSQIALDFAESVGYVLDDWQKWLTWWTFARRPDKLWAARDVGAEVARQNGKNIWLEVVELASLILFKDRLITHSAHRADTSAEHFLSMRERIESSDELMRHMPTKANGGFITSHGMESIEFRNGARLQFKARQNASGRGPRPQKIILDEALVLDFAKLGSAAPGISAQRNPQILFASSPPMATSEVLHSLRERAASSRPDDRLFYAAWNNPPEIDEDDRDAWYRANPSLGLGRLTEDSLLANRELLRARPGEFRREHLGIPEEPDETASVIPLDVWAGLVEVGSRIESHRAWALAVSPDRKWASIGVAGRRADGQMHVETMERQQGTAWVLDAVVDLYARSKLPIRIHGRGPAHSFIAPLREQGVDVVELTSNELAQATAQFVDHANAGTIHHLGQGSIDVALAGARIRPNSDGAMVWETRGSTEISALMAVTVAAGGVPAEAPVEFFAY